VTIDELIAAIRVLVDDGVRLRDIEEQLKMPLNSLSGMLNKKKDFPPKWIRKLTAYVEAKQKAKNSAPEPPKEPAVETLPAPPSPPAKKAIPASKQPIVKTPPAGMTKAQTIRFHRENNQTLQ